MTTRQKNFIFFYLASGNATEACKQAKISRASGTAYMRNPAILAELEKRQRVREDTALEILRNAQPQVAMRLTRIALAEETETPQVINAAKEILKDVLISRAETISRAEVLIKDQDAVLAESKAIIAELERRAALELPSSNPSPQQVVVGSENNGQSSANIDRQPQPS